ncbi:MAG: alanine racemase [Treponema sp.]|jgi:alanine racemase|nr:alanine racemase [Treponema sp.]
MRATRALVYVDRFRLNIRAVAARIGRRRICVPVKADAYGHGALPLARAALEAGADCLAVALVQEGEELRQGGVRAPILLFSQTLGEELEDLVRADLCPLVWEGAYIDALGEAALRAGRELVVHLKLDTGMGRAGCPPEEAAALAGRVLSHRALRLGGVATHLAVSDSPSPEDRAYTGAQLGRFRAAIQAIRDAGIDPGIIHAANSGALCFHPDAWFDMVRPGILLYGYGPPGAAPNDTAPGGDSARSDTLRPPAIPVRPVMELHSQVAAVKLIRRGESVSYGRTWTAPEDSLAALVPAGYADGLRRGLSNNWQMGIGGRLYPVAGRICMDQCLLNLGRPGSGPPVSPGEEVVIFGEGAGPAAGSIAAAPGDAAAMAEKLGTIPYEITCGISKRVPRVYL